MASPAFLQGLGGRFGTFGGFVIDDVLLFFSVLILNGFIVSLALRVLIALRRVEELVLLLVLRVLFRLLALPTLVSESDRSERKSPISFRRSFLGRVTTLLSGVMLERAGAMVGTSLADSLSSELLLSGVRRSWACCSFFQVRRKLS